MSAANHYEISKSGDATGGFSPLAAIEVVRTEVERWEGVTTHEHRFGGLEFRFGRRELGHLHGTIAGLPFPWRIRNELIAAGRALPHTFCPTRVA